jgi:hypothetical protein
MRADFIGMGNTRAFAMADNRTSLQTSGDSVLIEKISFLILFKTSSSQTDTFPEHQTEKLIALLDQFPEFSVRLEGRTDSIGSPTLGKFPIKKLELGNTFNFEDILFVGNRAEVLPEYRGAKTRLINMIRMASNYHFEIQGHINFRFSPPA